MSLLFKPSETEGESDQIFFGFYLYYFFTQPINIIGLILTLVAGRCKCCHCCACCSLQFGALLTSSPFTPYILGADGQLVMESATNKEDNKEEEVRELEMADTPSIVGSETKVGLEANELVQTMVESEKEVQM